VHRLILICIVEAGRVPVVWGHRDGALRASRGILLT
jgi:hypothetical protein